MKKIILISSNIPNENGRVYPKEILQKIVDQINSKDYNFGEIGYSESSTVNLSEVAFSYKEAFIEENKINVNIEILNTPKGEELKKILDDCVFRPKGTGTLSEDGKILDDYDLISINAVPKKEDAFRNILE